MNHVIKHIVRENQVGYIEGRSINDHIRLIDDVINAANVINLEGILVSLDYRKAFDTVSRSAIISALRTFNFGPVYISLVSTILNETEVAIKNAGWISSYFSTNQGIKQGCALSPLLFILVAEILAIKIRNNNNIKGIFENANNRIST